MSLALKIWTHCELCSCFKQLLEYTMKERLFFERTTGNKTGVINDPFGQTHSLASSEHCFRFKFLLFWKVGTDGRTNGRHVQKQWSLPDMTVGRPCGSILDLDFLCHQPSRHKRGVISIQLCMYFRCVSRKGAENWKANKTGVINDPLGLTNSLASSEHCFLCVVLLDLISGDGRTTCVKTIIPTGRDCGLAKWINRRWTKLHHVKRELWRRPDKKSFKVQSSGLLQRGNVNKRSTWKQIYSLFLQRIIFGHSIGSENGKKFMVITSHNLPQFRSCINCLVTVLLFHLSNTTL